MRGRESPRFLRMNGVNLRLVVVPRGDGVGIADNARTGLRERLREEVSGRHRMVCGKEHTGVERIGDACREAETGVFVEWLAALPI